MDTGAITGRVTDPSGAVVPGAQVTVTQTAMNFENVTQTNTEGLYRVQALRVGPYRVTVTAGGFKKLVQENIDLRTNDVKEVNVILEVGAAADSVEVAATAPLLDTQSSTSGQVLEGKVYMAEPMPLGERLARAAVFLLPNITSDNTAWDGMISGFYVNGMRGTQVGYFEDGMLGSNMYDGYGINPVMAGVEEVSVLTSALPAEYGHSAAGAINIVKKSGTNQIHGMAEDMVFTRRMFQRGFFEMFSFSSPSPGYPKGAPEIYNTPDAMLSGPVYIPKVYNGKNKTFFMMSTNIMVSHESKYNNWSTPYTVPTPEMLKGDFTYGGIGQPIYDPRTTRQDSSGNWLRDAFPNNIIPQNQWSNVAKTVIFHNPWVSPNIAGSVTTSGVSANLNGATGVHLWWPSYSFRVDHQFTQNVKVYAGLSWNKFYQPRRSPAITYEPFDLNEAQAPQYQYTPSLGMSWVISPTFISETRVAMYRELTLGDGKYQMAIADMLRNEAKVPNIPTAWYVGQINSGVGDNLGQSTLASVAVRGNHTFKQDLTKTWGTHVFKFGYDYLFMSENSHSISNPRLSFAFAGLNGMRTNGTSLPGTGNSFGAFLIGSLSSISVSQQGASWLPQTSVHSFYVQDDWRTLPTLTLNLGLRYSNESPLTTKYDAISVWDPNVKDDVAGSYAYCPSTGCVGMWTHPKGAWYNRDNNNFQPRLGLAWHPLGKVVLRGGFALNTQDMGLSWYTSRDEYDLSFSQSAPLGDYKPIGNIDQGPPTIIWPTRRADGTVPFIGTSINSRSGIIVPKDIHNPYSMNWNASLQYQVAKSYVVELSYAGSAGVGIIGNSNWNSRDWGIIPNPSGSGWMDLNDPANATYRNTWIGNSALQTAARPWTNWGTVNYRGNFGHSVFHSGTAKIEKRYSQGLTVLAFYTYGKCIDVNPGNPYLNWDLNRERCSYDQTNRFVSTMTYEFPLGKGQKFLNRGGLVNKLVGGFALTWNYQIYNSTPVGMGLSNSPVSGLSYPSWMPGFGGVMLTRRPQLRANWQDIGGDRFIQINQNSMIDCGTFQKGWGNDCFTWVPAYSRGNNGSNVWSKERLIAANVSVSKDVAVTERLKLQIRFDYQNPFKWFNWTGLSTTLDLNNPKLFGTPGVTEQDIAANGGHPLMWLFMGFKW